MPHFTKVLVENLSTGARYDVTRFQYGGIAYIKARVGDRIRIIAEADTVVGALWFIGGGQSTTIRKIYRNVKRGDIEFTIREKTEEVYVCIGPTPPGPNAKPLYAYVDIIFKAKVPVIPKIKTSIPPGWEVRVGDTISFDVYVYDEQSGRPLNGVVKAVVKGPVVLVDSKSLINGKATFKFKMTRAGKYSIIVEAHTPYGGAEAVYDNILTVVPTKAPEKPSPTKPSQPKTPKSATTIKDVIPILAGAGAVTAVSVALLLDEKHG